ncbi:MAG: hypothetical protein OEY85_07635, partial [Rhodospirillales bacterium]|nr:hypothetical protein [Rhodospirillales bacterium]
SDNCLMAEAAVCGFAFFSRGVFLLRDFGLAALVVRTRLFVFAFAFAFAFVFTRALALGRDFGFGLASVLRAFNLRDFGFWALGRFFELVFKTAATRLA